MVIVDTSVWIPALRRGDSPERSEVGALVERGDAAMVGTVLVEILRGARSQSDFSRLRAQLLGAEFLETDQSNWVLAAQILLELKLKGETIPMADAVIAAQAIEGGHAVYTTDKHFSRVEGLELYAAKKRTSLETNDD